MLEKNPNAEKAAGKIIQKLTYGLYIVTTYKDSSELTTRDQDWISAGTVAWAMQTSFEPRLVTIAVDKNSDLNETIGRSKHFALNVLGKEDKKLVDAFSGDSDVDIVDKEINGYPYEKGFATGCPVFHRTLGYLECEVVDELATEGDHMLFVGKVVNAEAFRPKEQPLTEANSPYSYGG